MKILFQILIPIRILQIYCILMLQYLRKKELDKEIVLNKVLSLLPRPKFQDRKIQIVSLIIVYFVMIAIIMLYIPFAGKFLINTFPDFTNYLKDGSFLYWIDSLSGIIEILIILLIGGSIYGESLAHKLRDGLLEYSNRRSEILEKEKDRLSNSIIILIDNIDSYIDSLKNRNDFFGNSRRIAVCFWELINLMKDEIPENKGKTLIAQFCINFPGGVHGILAFILFISLSVLKIISLYSKNPILAVS